MVSQIPLRKLLLVSDLATLGGISLNHWTVTRVTSWGEAIDFILKDIPDLIIGHFSTQKDQVMDFLATFFGYPPCPLGIIVEKEEAEQGIQCLAKGASDCILRESLTPKNWETMIDRCFIQGTSRQKDRISRKILETRLELSDYAYNHSLEELLTATLDLTESLTGSTIGFFHFVSEDEKELLLQCWSTRTKNFFCHAEGHGSHYGIEKAGVWIDCLRLRKPVIHNNYETMAQKKGMPPGHARVIRMLAVPVFRGDKVVAVLGVGNKPHDYGFQEVDISLQIADLAWDISERKRSEEESKIWAARLQMQKRREALGTMAAGVAHDFNNLLSAIGGYADLIKEEITPDSQTTEYFKSIDKAISKAGELCRQMLSSTGGGRIWVQPLNLANQLKEMESWIRAQVPRKVNLEINLDTTAPLVDADQGQLRQVIMNLITNSSEAIGENDGMITITCGWSPWSKALAKEYQLNAKDFTLGTVWIRIDDTGPGFEQGDIDKAFEPFFTSKFQGRGLGLPAVYGIMEAHKGAVSLTSEKNKGTCVTVFFPVSSEKPSPGPQVSSKTSSPITSTQKAILLADDELILREATAKIIASLGYEVLRARTGKEAVEIFREKSSEIRLCLLDYTMPEMGGAEALIEIRKIAPGARVLITSGYAIGEVSASFGKEKADGFLSKPYNRESLLEILSPYLDEKLIIKKD